MAKTNHNTHSTTAKSWTYTIRWTCIDETDPGSEPLVEDRHYGFSSTVEDRGRRVRVEASAATVEAEGQCEPGVMTVTAVLLDVTASSPMPVYHVASARPARAAA